MKIRYFILSLISVLLLAGCAIVDPSPKAGKYIYVNSTETTITVNAYRAVDDGKIYSASFTLQSGGEKEFVYSSGYSYNWVVAPFNGLIDNYLLIDNGERWIEQGSRYSPIYKTENYELVKEEQYINTYKFTFTDDYFANGRDMSNYPAHARE